MEAISVLVDNYKEATKGLSIYAKVIFALVLFFIFVAVISAFVNVILYGV